MGPYSHYILAARLAVVLRPDDCAAYYWGAVAPDIRYLAQMRRDTTHLSRERVNDLTARYPHLRSFLTGYLVHLLIDEIDVARTASTGFPLNLLQKALRKRLTTQQATMLVEMYFLQSGTAGERMPGVRMAGEHNEVLAELGITAQQTRVYHEALQTYFDGRSFEAAICAFQKLGMVENSRIEKYQNAFRAMEKRKLLKTVYLMGIKNSRLEAKVMGYVQANLAYQPI